MRAAIYLRQSQDRTDEGKAISRQLEDCSALCERHGWEWSVYEDNDTSASTRKPRPEYERMKADIQSGTVEAVVCWHPDRLYRQLRDLEDLIDLAVPIHTVSGDLDLKTDMGRTVARILGSVARGEVERKSQRQKRAAEQHAKTGGGWGGRRAFGYEQGSNDIRRSEATLIRKAYTAILAGETLYSIAAQWNSKGVTTTVGNAWSGSTVRQVLVNPRYKGARAYKGEVVADATWKPIVDPTVWQSVHDTLTDAGRRRGGGVRSRLLTGILICGQCNAPMGSGVANSDGAAIYVCKKCHRLSRRLEPVDKLIEGLAVGFLSRPDSIRVLIAEERQDTAELREQERALLTQLDKLAADRYDPEVGLSATQFKAANDRLNARLADVRRGMRDSHRVRVFDGLEDAVARGAVRQWWDGLGLDRQRAILPLLFTVKLKPMGRGRPFDRTHVDLQWVTGDE